MKTKMFFENVADIEATMQITMKLSDWKALQATLQNKWPAWNLSSRISDLLIAAEKTLWASDAPKERD